MLDSEKLAMAFTSLDLNPKDRIRYQTLRDTLSPYKSAIEGKRVLDFGAAFGLSAAVMIEYGASYVWGIETDEERVRMGQKFLATLGLSDRVKLSHVEDTRKLDVPDSSFDLVLVNAVLEHIPQPRTEYIREMWRVLTPGGTLIVNETPNKYLPIDFHTLNLPLTNWLPSSLAHRVGTLFGRFDPMRTDWSSSGWRGMGYWEFVNAIPGPFVMEHEMTRGRHRLFRTLGLPSGLIDPYPVYRARKAES
jgi:2-polyprenyl-3-methyl-5-hydroxy-6-metoxy-1,4-benzoquinol methylase